MWDRSSFSGFAPALRGGAVSIQGFAPALRGGAIIVLGALLAAGCYGQTTPATRVAKLRVVAEPSTTVVYVDDRYVGSARVLATRPKVFQPGIKFITFKAPDHFPHDVRVDLPPGTTTIKMKLRPIPP